MPALSHALTAPNCSGHSCLWVPKLIYNLKWLQSRSQSRLYQAKPSVTTEAATVIPAVHASVADKSARVQSSGSPVASPLHASPQGRSAVRPVSAPRGRPGNSGEACVDALVSSRFPNAWTALHPLQCDHMVTHQCPAQIQHACATSTSRPIPGPFLGIGSEPPIVHC